VARDQRERAHQRLVERELGRARPIRGDDASGGGWNGEQGSEQRVLEGQ
jgi:hypothetical protein